jgi:PAS domain S-box-containing protein
MHHTQYNSDIAINSETPRGWNQRLYDLRFLLMSLGISGLSLLISTNLDKELGSMVSNAYFLVIPATLVLVSVLSVRKHGVTDKNKGILWLFVIYAILSAVAEISWIVYESVLQKDPYPSVADLFWLASYPILLVFLLAYLKPIRKSIPQNTKVFSAVICGGFIIPTLTISYFIKMDLAPTELLLSMSYPILETAILFVVMTATISMAGKKNNEFLIAILFAMIFFTISDVLFLLEAESYAGGELADIGWLYGYVLLVFGVLRYKQIEKGDAYTHHVYVENNKIVNSIDFEPTTKLLIPITVLTICIVTFILIAFDIYASSKQVVLPNFIYYVVGGSLISFAVITLFVNKKMISLVRNRTHELELERDALQVQIKENKQLLAEKTKYAEVCKNLSEDITNTLEKVAISESKYRNLYENSLEMYRTVNKEGIIIACNKAYAKHLGYSKDEIIGKSIFDHVDEKHAQLLESTFNEWKKRGIVESRELFLKRKDGTTFPVLMSVSSLYDAGGNLIGSNTAFRDISELYQARKKIEEREEKLKNTLEKLLRLTTAKDEFVAMVTHELKTPLVPIISYVELLLSGKLGQLTAEQKKRLYVVKSSSQSLHKMISDLLDVQKIELGQLRLDIGLFNIVEIIKTAIIKMEPLAIKNRIQLTMSCSEKINCFCDQVRIEQVLTNLITNAIDFCPKENGRIDVRAYVSGNLAKIIVQDNGIGIVKNKLDKIFVKFYQIDSGRTREHAGTGLGLAVCKGIIEGHGGKIWAESEGPGTGTQIHITLPLGNHETTANLLQ